MSCDAYAQEIGLPIPSTSDEFYNFQQQLFSDGLGCLQTFHQQCATLCTDITQDPEPCFRCLGNGWTCTESPGVPIAHSPTPCCPHAKLAFNCQNCLGKAGNNQYANCDSGKISETETIIISVSVTFVVILVAVLAWVYFRRKKSSSEASAFEQNLGIRADSALGLELSRLDNDGAFSNVVEMQEQRKLRDLTAQLANQQYAPPKPKPVTFTRPNDGFSL